MDQEWDRASGVELERGMDVVSGSASGARLGMGLVGKSASILQDRVSVVVLGNKDRDSRDCTECSRRRYMAAADIVVVDKALAELRTESASLEWQGTLVPGE